jgi:hypothetical protein
MLANGRSGHERSEFGSFPSERREEETTGQAGEKKL